MHCKCKRSISVLDRRSTGLTDRQAHNLKVGGSNPPPATKMARYVNDLTGFLLSAVCSSSDSGSILEAGELRKMAAYSWPNIPGFWTIDRAWHSVQPR